MTDALIGMGTRVYMQELPTSTVLTLLGEVFSVELPEDAVGEVEATHYGSPDNMREFIDGLNEPGTGSIGLNWVPGSDTDELLRTARQDRGKRITRVVTPPDDGSQMFTWTGKVNAYVRGLPMDDKLTGTVTSRATSKVVEADASAEPSVI